MKMCVVVLIGCTVNVLKFRTLGCQKRTSRADPDQTASEEAV